MAKQSKQLDRRWLFLFIFVGVALPLIFTIGFPIETTDIVQKVYDFVEETPEGSRVIISFDYDPASKPELHPMARSLVKHCFDRKIKIIITALWPMGVQMAEDIISQLKDNYPDLKYGEDYVNLGFKAGGMVVIQAMGKRFREIFPKDMYGSSLDELPL